MSYLKPLLAYAVTYELQLDQIMINPRYNTLACRALWSRSLDPVTCRQVAKLALGSYFWDDLIRDAANGDGTFLKCMDSFQDFNCLEELMVIFRYPDPKRGTRPVLYDLLREPLHTSDSTPLVPNNSPAAHRPAEGFQHVVSSPLFLTLNGKLTWSQFSWEAIDYYPEAWLEELYPRMDHYESDVLSVFNRVMTRNATQTPTYRIPKIVFKFMVRQ